MCSSDLQLFRRAVQRAQPIDNFAEVAYYDEHDLGRWITQKAQFLRRDYMQYPALVHVETLAQCNASCNFCPAEPSHGGRPIIQATAT